MPDLDDPVRKLWCEQPVEGMTMSVEEIRRRAGRLERTIRWRNLREYVASLVGVAMIGYFFLTTHGLLARTTFALFIGGLAWIMAQLRRKGAAKRMPPGADTSTSLRFYRAELQRQRDMLASVWAWYLAPLIPGFVVYTIGHAVTSPRVAVWVGLAVLDGVVAALFFLVWKVNQRAARHVQRVLDALNRAE